MTPAQAGSLAILRWNRIACGAEAFLNGQKAGEKEPTGPFQVVVPKGVLQPGENQIVLKIRGAAAVRRSKSGNALIPAGFGVGLPEVTDDVWIDFADIAYVKWVLALPDFAGSRVNIRITPTRPPTCGRSDPGRSGQFLARRQNDGRCPLPVGFPMPPFRSHP